MDKRVSKTRDAIIDAYLELIYEKKESKDYNFQSWPSGPTSPARPFTSTMKPWRISCGTPPTER